MYFSACPGKLYSKLTDSLTHAHTYIACPWDYTRSMFAKGKSRNLLRKLYYKTMRTASFNVIYQQLQSTRGLSPKKQSRLCFSASLKQQALCHCFVISFKIIGRRFLSLQFSFLIFWIIRCGQLSELVCCLKIDNLPIFIEFQSKSWIRSAYSSSNGCILPSFNTKSKFYWFSLTQLNWENRALFFYT